MKNLETPETSKNETPKERTFFGAVSSGKAEELSGVARNFASGENKAIIHTDSGELSDLPQNREYVDKVGQVLSNNTASFTAGGEKLTDETIDALEHEARRKNADASKKGTIEIIDVHSSQHQKLHNIFEPLNVDVLSHEQPYATISRAKEDAKKSAEKPEEAKLDIGA